MDPMIQKNYQKIKDMEICRLSHEGVNYIVGADIEKFRDIEIPYPWVSVTTKSSKKNRDKRLGDKYYEHFDKLDIKNSLSLFHKVQNIFSDFLKDYEFVMFSANRDHTRKRERIYMRYLEKMGFNLLYIFSFSCKDRSILMARDHVKIKKKDLKKIEDILGA